MLRYEGRLIRIRFATVVEIAPKFPEKGNFTKRNLDCHKVASKKRGIKELYSIIDELEFGLNCSNTEI